MASPSTEMTPSRCDLRRVAVIGTSCAGKTTFAGRLGTLLGTSCHQLDAVYWGPDWRETPDDEFRAAIATIVQHDRWIIEGNYAVVRDLVWRRATCVVWLNYAFVTVFARALRRTVSRVWSQEPLFSGNRERFRTSFLSRESILWWVITTYRRRRRAYRQLLGGTEYPHLGVIEFHRPHEASEFLDSLAARSTVITRGV
jgi:adenylate kinase family enzyme